MTKLHRPDATTSHPLALLKGALMAGLHRAPAAPSRKRSLRAAAAAPAALTSTAPPELSELADLADLADYQPLDTAGVGEFAWQWDLFGTFNAATWSFLNTLALPGEDGAVQLLPGLTTWVWNTLSATVYSWTAADRALLDGHLAAARDAQERLVTAFLTDHGPLTAEDRAEAARLQGGAPVSTLGCIVDYRIAHVWSGRQAAGLPALQPSQIRAASPATLFATAPAGAADRLMPLLTEAFAREADWAACLDDLWGLSQALQTAADHARSPQEANLSGRTVQDANGQMTPRSRFEVTPPVPDLRRALSADTPLVSTFVVDHAPDGAAIVTTADGTRSPVPAATAREVLALVDAEGKARDLLAAPGSGDRAEVRITYHGPAEVTVQPTPFDGAAQTGWFDLRPVVLAAQNHAQARTEGYLFQLPVTLGPDPGQRYSLLRRLLICRAVTLDVRFPQGDAAQLARSLPLGTTHGHRLRLLGGKHLGLGPAGAVQTRLTQDTEGPCLRVAAAPAVSGTPGPLAHVIGVQLDRPLAPPDATMTTAAAPPRKMRLRAAPPPQAAPHDLVQNYEAQLGPIPPDALNAAKVTSKRDWIIDHLLAAQWSGRARAGLPPLTRAEMRAAPSLRTLFPEMPLGGSALLGPLAEQLGKTPPSAT